MAQKAKEYLFGDIVAESINIDKANAIRSKIILNTIGNWVFVVKDGFGNYNVAVQNTWGAKLSKDELQIITDLLATEKVEKKKRTSKTAKGSKKSASI